MSIIEIIENFETVMPKNQGLLINYKAHPTTKDFSDSLNKLVKQDADKINSDFLKLVQDNRLIRVQLGKEYQHGPFFGGLSEIDIYTHIKRKSLLEIKKGLLSDINYLITNDSRLYRRFFSNLDQLFSYRSSIYTLQGYGQLYNILSIFCDYWYIKKSGTKKLDEIDYSLKKDLFKKTKEDNRALFVEDCKAQVRSKELETLLNHYQENLAYLDQCLSYLSQASLILSNSYFPASGVSFDLINTNKYPFFKSTMYQDLFDEICLEIQSRTGLEPGITFYTFMFYYFQDLGFIKKDTRPMDYRDFLKEEYRVSERQLQTRTRGMNYQNRALVESIIEQI